jgi:hypothetical protein
VASASGCFALSLGWVGSSGVVGFLDWDGPADGMAAPLFLGVHEDHYLAAFLVVVMKKIG